MEHKHGINIQFINPNKKEVGCESCTVTLAEHIRTRNLRDVTRAVARAIDSIGYYREHTGETECRWKERIGNKQIIVTTYKED